MSRDDGYFLMPADDSLAALENVLHAYDRRADENEEPISIMMDHPVPKKRSGSGGRRRARCPKPIVVRVRIEQEVIVPDPEMPGFQTTIAPEIKRLLEQHGLKLARILRDPHSRNLAATYER